MKKRSGKILNFLRMSDHDFCFLLQLLEPIISKENTRLRRSISAKERFIALLHVLGLDYLHYLHCFHSHPEYCPKSTKEKKILIFVNNSIKIVFQIPNTPAG